MRWRSGQQKGTTEAEGIQEPKKKPDRVGTLEPVTPTEGVRPQAPENNGGEAPKNPTKSQT